MLLFKFLRHIFVTLSYAGIGFACSSSVGFARLTSDQRLNWCWPLHLPCSAIVDLCHLFHNSKTFFVPYVLTHPSCGLLTFNVLLKMPAIAAGGPVSCFAGLVQRNLYHSPVIYGPVHRHWYPAPYPGRPEVFGIVCW